MFTGIVQRLGNITDIKMEGTAGRITMLPNRAFDKPIGLGDSIAVNGTCLTVAAMDGDTLMFDVLGETFDKTNLGEKKPGDLVNLEQALALGDTGYSATYFKDIGQRLSVSVMKVDRQAFELNLLCHRLDHCLGFAGGADADRVAKGDFITAEFHHPAGHPGDRFRFDVPFIGATEGAGDVAPNA